MGDRAKEKDREGWKERGINYRRSSGRSQSPITPNHSGIYNYIMMHPLFHQVNRQSLFLAPSPLVLGSVLAPWQPHVPSLPTPHGKVDPWWIIPSIIGSDQDGAGKCRETPESRHIRVESGRRKDGKKDGTEKRGKKRWK